MKTLTYHKQAYLDMDSIKTYFNLQLFGSGETFILNLKSDIDKLKLFDCNQLSFYGNKNHLLHIILHLQKH